MSVKRITINGAHKVWMARIAYRGQRRSRVCRSKEEFAERPHGGPEQHDILQEELSRHEHVVAGGTPAQLQGKGCHALRQGSAGVPFAGRPEPKSTEAVVVQSIPRTHVPLLAPSTPRELSSRQQSGIARTHR
jgi:hypothetical protein